MSPDNASKYRASLARPELRLNYGKFSVDYTQKSKEGDSAKPGGKPGCQLIDASGRQEDAAGGGQKRKGAPRAAPLPSRVGLIA